jgi:hypothetical protein
VENRSCVLQSSNWPKSLIAHSSVENLIQKDGPDLGATIFIIRLTSSFLV